MYWKALNKRIVGTIFIGALLLTGTFTTTFAQEANGSEYVARLTMRLAGEGSFALEPLACVALNRLNAGWGREKLLDRETTPFYAPDVEVTSEQIEIVRQVMIGKLPCDERLYYALGGGDKWRPHDRTAVHVVQNGEKSVWFFDK